MLIRFFDVLLSGMALVVLSPLLIPIMLFLKFSGEGEIFFLQERVGKNREMFKLFKFATMLKDSPSMGTGTVTMKNDPRVLPAGKFLRKTKCVCLSLARSLALQIVGYQPNQELNTTTIVNTISKREG